MPTKLTMNVIIPAFMKVRNGITPNMGSNTQVHSPPSIHMIVNAQKARPPSHAAMTAKPRRRCVRTGCGNVPTTGAVVLLLKSRSTTREEAQTAKLITLTHRNVRAGMESKKGSLRPAPLITTLAVE